MNQSMNQSTRTPVELGEDDLEGSVHLATASHKSVLVDVTVRESHPCGEPGAARKRMQSRSVRKGNTCAYARPNKSHKQRVMIQTP